MKKTIVFTMLLGIAVFVLASFLDPEPVNKQELGKLLFFDPLLSSNKKISCASCHRPDFAFADTTAFSRGVKHQLGVRNTPSAMNVSLQRVFFWDGRAASLEEQALAPIENPVEMNLPIEKALLRLRNNTAYRRYFKKIFNEEPNRENLAAALAAFERTLETSDSPFDNWRSSGDSTIVNAAVRRGFILFNGKGKCNRCHFGADFTANEFRNIGLFNGRELNDSGRASISKLATDIGKFKTAALRNVALTAPYMHNGKFKTLEQVIDFYNDPQKIVPQSIGRDTILAKPLGLTDLEKSDLKELLLSFTDKRFIKGDGLKNRPAK